MNNIKGTNSLFDFHNQLDDFITSIDAIKNQNLDYEVIFKDWTRTKEFTIVQKVNESDEEVIDRTSTVVDQTIELNQRNNLLVQGMNEFLLKIEVLKII